MTPRRLIPAEAVERWEKELHDAAVAAVEQMHHHVHAALASQGIRTPSALVAAGRKQTGLGTGLTVWNDPQWTAAVTTHVQPVASRIAGEALGAARDAVPANATWGMPSSQAAIAGVVVGAAVAAGAYLGARLNADVSAATQPAQAAEDVFATAGDIIGGQTGASSAMIGNYAVQDVSSYLSGYMGNTYDGATKTWSAVLDDRTRPDHADADGQEVSINEPFIVGGEALLFPGDPDGSDWNTISCRCITVTDGIDPGIAIYGEPEPEEPGGAEERTAIEEQRAARETSAQSTPRSNPT